jgi:hypothetical protein
MRHPAPNTGKVRDRRINDYTLDGGLNGPEVENGKSPADQFVDVKRSKSTKKVIRAKSNKRNMYASNGFMLANISTETKNRVDDTMLKIEKTLSNISDRKTFDPRKLSPNRAPLTVNKFLDNKKKLNNYHRNLCKGDNVKNYKSTSSKNNKLNYKEPNQNKHTDFTCNKFENFSQKLHAASSASEANKSSMVNSDLEQRKSTVDIDQYYKQNPLMMSEQELPISKISNDPSHYTSKNRKNIADNCSKPVSQN